MNLTAQLDLPKMLKKVLSCDGTFFATYLKKVFRMVLPPYAGHAGSVSIRIRKEFVLRYGFLKKIFR